MGDPGLEPRYLDEARGDDGLHCHNDEVEHVPATHARAVEERKRRNGWKGEGEGRSQKKMERARNLWRWGRGSGRKGGDG